MRFETAILNHGYVAVLKSTEGNLNPESSKYKYLFKQDNSEQ